MVVKIDKTWRDKVGEKYIKNPGIWTCHDFLIVRHPTTYDVMKQVRENCATKMNSRTHP